MRSLLMSVVILMLIIQGCSAKKVVTENQYTKPFLGKNDLYAAINLKTNKVEIISNQINIGNSTTYVMKLNDLKPIFDVQSFYCGASMTAEANSGKNADSRCSSNIPFRKNDIMYGNAAADAVSTAGIASLAMLFKGPPRYSVFDNEEYVKSVSQAMAGLANSREDIIFKYDSVIDNNDKAKITYNALFDNAYNESKNKYDIQYNLMFVKPIVNDKSGIYKYKHDFENDIKIVENDIDANNHFLPSYSPTIKSSPDKFFDDCSFSIKETNKVYDINNDDYTAKLNEFKGYLSDITSTVKSSYSENINKNGFSIVINAADKVKLKYGVKQPVQANVTILKLDSINIYPEYSNSDNGLVLIFDGKNIKFENKTANFLQIKSISVYYNSKISNIELSQSIELPPESFKNDLDISSFVNNEIIQQAKFSDLTINNTKKVSISFGFAIKYRNVQQNIDKSLYVSKKYNLYDLVTKI